MRPDTTLLASAITLKSLAKNARLPHISTGPMTKIKTLEKTFGNTPAELDAHSLIFPPSRISLRGNAPPPLYFHQNSPRLQAR